MKILHLIFSFNVGGAETMLIDIINQQIQKHKVALLIINNQCNETLIRKINSKVDIILLNRIPKSRNIVDVFRLNYYLSKIHPDIIHCHEFNIIKYIFFKRLYTSVLTVHDTQLPIHGSLIYNKIVAISNAVQEDLKTKEISSDVIYNGIETKKILKKTEYNIISDLHIIQISRIEIGKKGQDILLKAISLLKANHINIHVDFIGTGDSMYILKKMVNELELTENVRFLGMQDRTYIYSHLREYDLLVQPSIFEGFGLTVIEGMVAGLPVLVSNVDGPMEIIQNGEYGFVFQTQNAEDLAKQINYIIQHPDLSKKIAYKGQQYAIKKFDISTTVNNYEKLYFSSICHKL